MNETFMKEKPVLPLLVSMALPNVISMLVNSLYNIVDSLFVARISEDAMTALSLVFPIQNFANAIAIGFGIGINAMIALYLGAGDHKKAETAATHGMALSLMHGILITIVSIVIMPGFLRRFTSDAGLIASGITYSTIVFLFATINMAALAFEKMFQAVGRMKVTMAALIFGCVCNILLDPILIFGWFGLPRMEVAGAAIATVAGQIVAAAAALVLNLKCNRDIHLLPREIRWHGKVAAEIYRVGFPSIVMQSIGSAMVFGMNKILFSFTKTATAVFGAYFKLQSFIFMPVFGLNNGVVPIVAYNYGAQNRLRMVETIKRSTIYASCIMVLGVIIFWAIPGPLLKIFDATDTMLQVGVPALRIISLSFCMAGACIALGSSFQALGKAVYSMTTSIIRQLVFLVPIAYVLARYGYSIGNDDLVWWSYPLAEIASLLVTLVFFRRLYRTLIAPLPANGGAPVHDDSDDDPIGE